MVEPWVTSVWSLEQGLILPFWVNVLRAANLNLPSSVVDCPRLTSEVLVTHLSTNTTWLTSSTVAGFRAEEYAFLAPAEVSRLAAAVDGVQAVVSELRAGQLATFDQRERARPHFLMVLTTLEFDRYGDVAALILGKRVEQELAPIRPTALDHVRFRTGQDSTDDPALWVWAFVKELSEHDERVFFKGVDEIRPALEPIARGAAPGRRVYLRFRSTLDQPEAGSIAA